MALDQENCFDLSGECEAAEDGASSLWWAGVIISILGSVLSNFGVNTQKYSMILEIRAGRVRPYVRQPLWLLGMLMVILGALADFGALGFAAQSLITPVGGFTMVANLFFASYWLGEIITRQDLVSTGAIIGGIVLIAAFADKREQCFTLDALRCLYARRDFVLYAVFIGSLMVAVYLLVLGMRRRMAALTEDGRQDERSYKRMLRALPLLCAALSGLIGAQSVLFAKSVIEIIKSAGRGGSPFASFETYLIILAMFGAIFGQIHWLAVGLAQFDAVVIVPVFQAVFVTVTIVAGGAYFDEFRGFSLLQKICFPVGVLVLIVGVLGLARHKSRSAEDLLQIHADGSLFKPDAEAPAGPEAQQRRRESFQRYEEFTRRAPYGALTGRFVPLELLLGEAERGLERSFERVGSFLQFANTGGEGGGSSSKRRSSTPGRSNERGGSVTSQPGAADSSMASRQNRGGSFAVIEGFLHLAGRMRRGTSVGGGQGSSQDASSSQGQSSQHVAAAADRARRNVDAGKSNTQPRGIAEADEDGDNEDDSEGARPVKDLDDLDTR